MADDRRNFYFFYHQSPSLKEKVETLKSLLLDYDMRVVEDPKTANIIVAVGGDGTFLQAVRKTGFREDCLYVGIGTNDQQFYCDFHIEDIDGMIEAIQLEKIEVRRYPTIKVTVDQNASFYCLNECSIRSSIIKTFAMEVYIDDFYFETFRGDGMIISTPTGSTAYNKSVNGAVVDPKLQTFQVSEIASINNRDYRTLGSSFLLSGERTLTLKIIQDGNDYPIIGMDNEALSIRHCKEIHAELGDRRIKTVKLKDNSFWHKVQRMFLT